MNNSVFGKAMKYICNPKDVRLVPKKNQCVKLVMNSTFNDGGKFSENLLAVEMGKAKIKIMRPVYLVAINI